MLRVCLDTNTHSARTTGDLGPAAEQAAVEEIERLHQAGLIRRATTPVTKDEERRTRNPQMRALLDAGGATVWAVQASPKLLGFSHLDHGARGFIASPIMSDIDDDIVAQLTVIGVGHNDARALAFAVGVNGKCDYFVTVDTKDLLGFRTQIEALLPTIKVRRPTEFVAEWNAHYASR